MERHGSSISGAFRIASMAMCAGSALLLASPIAARRIDTVRAREGRWSIAIQHDRFTDLRTCTVLESKQVTYLPAAVGIRFGLHVDTLHAWYRVDAAAAIRWQDRYPVLIASHVPLDDGRLDSPTGGVLWIPMADLGGAHEISVRLKAAARPKKIDISGLDQAVARARDLGCQDYMFRP